MLSHAKIKLFLVFSLQNAESRVRRLVTDDIHIKEGDDEYYFSERFSPEYMEKLKDSKFYIIDINGDGILDIGIKFPTNVLTTYRYDQEEDSLIPSIGLHMYTEILGEGQYMTVSSSASQSRLQEDHKLAQ